MKFGNLDVYAQGLLKDLPPEVLNAWAEPIAANRIPTDITLLVFASVYGGDTLYTHLPSTANPRDYDTQDDDWY